MKHTVTKLTFLLFMCFILNSPAQTGLFQDDYILQKSAGNLPPIFTTSATDKANTDIATVQKEKNYYTKKAKEHFYVISNFQIDRMMRSGKILFNDSICQFVNRVADEVFKNNSELRKGLQIYVLKSDIVNAFTADNGVVIISMGLLSQLDNEAQLAFILCHEATHYQKKHSVESYVTRQNANRRYSKENFDEYKYSQDAEFEADAGGLKLFNQTKYSYKGITGAFNTLKYSYLPFDEVKFERSFFEDEDLVFPDAYFLKELNAIKVDENYDDSKSSHPNVKKRKDNISRELGEFTDDGREKFLVDKEAFLRMREMARFEMCNIDLMQEEYADCIYESYVLLKKYPNNKYLQRMIGKALMNMAAAKAPQEKQYKDCIVPSVDIAGSSYISYDYTRVEGNSQQVYHLLDKLSAAESNILALHYNWKLKNKYPEDKQLNKLCDSLFVLLALNNETGAGYFHKKSRKEYLAEAMPQMPDVKLEKDSALAIPADTAVKKLTSLDDLEMDDEDSKISHIEVQKTELVLTDSVNTDSARIAKIYTKLTDEFDKYALTGLLKDEGFKNKLNKAEEFNTAYRNRKFNSIIGIKRQTENKGGMGIDKIIILDPFYIKTDERVRDNYQFYASEEKLVEFGDVLKENAQIAGLETSFIDSHTLNKTDIDKYNDYTMLNDWMSEFLEHGYNRNMLILSTDAAAKMQEKYNTRYVLWSGVYTNRTKKENVGSAVALTIFSLGLLSPITLPYIFRKEQHTMYFCVLYDLQENDIMYTSTTVVRLKDSGDFLNAFVYDTMLSIKAKPVIK